MGAQRVAQRFIIRTLKGECVRTRGCSMTIRFCGLLAVGLSNLVMMSLGVAASRAASEAPDTKISLVPEPTESPRYLKDANQRTQGSVTIGGHVVTYQAEAGVLVVHVKDPLDDDAPPPKDERTGPPPPQPPEASMSYVAYFKGDKEDLRRPITFLFNGGPGSSTVWLHMGAFGPKRVITSDGKHSPAAPYRVVDNESSLIETSDLVFVDAPGTGFGHLRGAEKEKAFFGVDQDAHAFANFIVEFLSRHNRWNSPKYLFGESYGTTRSAVLANILQSEKSVDLNGVILLSQILNFDNSPDQPQFNPGVDLPYVLALPTYAATAWYHHKLANQPASLEPLLREVESFALNDYAPALAAGFTLSPERRAAIVAKLSAYTGLAPDYIDRADLRVNGGEFEKNLLGSYLTMVGPARYSLRRTHHRPAEQGVGLRSAIGGDFFGVCIGVQRLCARHVEIRRELDVQADHRPWKSMG
jgi:carboxypeptidase C (cathepsin A)